LHHNQIAEHLNGELETRMHTALEEPTMGNPKILVTGATGKTGGYAIKTLLELKVPVRALVHRIDARSEELSADGVEIAHGDLSDFEAVNEALKGITGAYFVYPIEVPGILEATAFFVQAALEQGVGAIVNMSQISARRIAKSHAAQNHWVAERLLDRSGIPVTHLRPTFFAEWLEYFSDSIREKDMFPLPFGDARYAPIAAEDQGRVIAAILNDPAEHAGKIYPLYGPKELTQYEVADILTQVLGRKITYAALEIKDFMEIWKKTGFSAYNHQHIAAVAQDCRDGIFSGTNDLVEKITGQKPLGMMDYILKNKALFSQSAAARA
jgi:NAD(P)H dehydrogenase (quinone)